MAAALDDEDDLVRVTATESLRASLDLEDAWKPRFSRLREIGQRLLAERPRVWREASAEMRAIVAARRADRSPETLGLTEPTEAWQADVDQAEVEDALRVLRARF